ncbi:flagellar basal body-associated FliL family protein [Thetidibacter halocola]|uniref:Flagellar basal body-associated FliL family protein n=1 Tax=Thetidibacter halocola TaxID=2827239 RepID=A0A8J7WEE3_9RHOB|nr:flagellar basal body-associated FliL family protein [Thetidibacter halocola]MBS0123654.1 flagellar basal body-associated FliL family protein [Thetidibacter halocola]
MRKLLPIILALVGTGAGVGAGMALMPSGKTETAEAAAIVCPPPGSEVAHETAPMAAAAEPLTNREYIKLNNQFIVPIIASDRVSSLVVVALSIEVGRGEGEIVYSREPKLRDVFLQVLMDHANVGGFDGNFTDGERMRVLRRALLEAARPVLADTVSDVLITEIARQDN